MIELKLTYAYFLLKIFDLLDTVFFVLRKKNSHLSFLHCYHHFFMVLGSYIAMRWLPGGPPILLGCINTFVHVIVYFYYLLTAFNPELKNSIWWKKHITQIQLVKKQRKSKNIKFNSLNFPASVCDSRDIVWNGSCDCYEWKLWLSQVLALGIGNTEHIFPCLIWRFLSKILLEKTK